MKLCVVIRVRRASKVRGVTPDTFVVHEAELVSSTLQPEKHVHLQEMAAGDLIRVCVPLTMVQMTLDLEASSSET